jgi:serine/threonine protein kinase
LTDHQGQQFDNYRIIHQLGAGSFGTVYLAEHIYRRDQDPVAIKVLSQLSQDSQDGLRSFLAEARTTRLKHPNIIEVLDFGVARNIPFIVMEYAPNGTLRKRHPKGTRVSLPTIVYYVKQIASALQYAHDERLVHCDIKPENLLIGEQDQILLSDFGLATAARSMSSESLDQVAGTIAYMAPEQIQSHPHPASDQYSLAVVVYEWLCGERPFQGSFTEIAAKHTMIPPPPLHNKIPTITPEVEQIVMKALAKDPKQRFESISAFATSLELACANMLNHATQSLALEPVPDPESSSQPLSGMNHEVTQGLEPIPDPEPSSQLLSGAGHEATQSLPHVPVPEPSSQPLSDMDHVLVPKLRSQQPSITTLEIEETPTPTQPQTSRRKIALGLGTGLVLAVATGGFAWPSISHQLQPLFKLDLTPTPIPIPLGKLLYTYTDPYPDKYSKSVNAIAWSPNGKYIASGSNDSLVLVRNATNGSSVYTYQGHTSHQGASHDVEAVAWSPNSLRIASGAWDKTVQVWDATSGRNVYTYKGHSKGVYAVAWSPDGKFIASGSYDQTVQVWNASNGNLIFTYSGHSNAVSSVAWSPDGKRIASGSYDKTVQVWDAINGGNPIIYRGHSDIVVAVAWSPHNKYIVSSAGNSRSPNPPDDTTVQICDATNGHHVLTYRGHSDVVNAVAWSYDGKRIASGSVDTTVQIWNAINGNTIFIYRRHSSEVRAVACSPDDSRIASADDTPTVQVWEAG